MKFLTKNNFIVTDEAKKLGINPMMLSRLAKAEVIFRVERGLYTNETAWLTHPLKKYLPICTAVPEAVICGISALTYYGLTDEEERQIWIALPAYKKLRNPRYRLVRATGSSYKLGIQTHIFGKRSVRMYDVEKTVADAFKYLPEEVALKALKGYLKRKNKDVQKLCKYAQKIKKPIDSIIRVLQAEE